MVLRSWELGKGRIKSCCEGTAGRGRRGRWWCHAPLVKPTARGSGYGSLRWQDRGALQVLFTEARMSDVTAWRLLRGWRESSAWHQEWKPALARPRRVAPLAEARMVVNFRKLSSKPDNAAHNLRAETGTRLARSRASPLLVGDQQGACPAGPSGSCARYRASWCPKREISTRSTAGFIRLMVLPSRQFGNGKDWEVATEPPRVAWLMEGCVGKAVERSSVVRRSSIGRPRHGMETVAKESDRSARGTRYGSLRWQGAGAWHRSPKLGSCCCRASQIVLKSR
jgi:hypothetical protein